MAVAAFIASFFPLILMGILFFVFWLMMLIDAATRKFKNENDKVVWILVVALASTVGALVYYFVVYFNDKSKSLKWLWVSLLGLFVLWVFLMIFALLVS